MKDEKTSAYFCTGVLATPEEVAEMKFEYSLPLARIGGRWPEPEKMVHKFALAHGLPEIAGHYGCDFRDGEFICEKEAGEPTTEWKRTP
jgi:hypothetical protein